MGSTANLNPPASSVAVHAAVYCPALWEGDPRIGENSDSERERQRVSCVPTRGEAAFHEAFDRGLAVERTREPGEPVGVMLEDVGTVKETTATGSAGHEPEWRRTMPAPEIER